MAGNNVYWNSTAEYKTGAFVLGSDNALYYCKTANGSASPQNPVSASAYWLKIINSNGKINADNLSVSLGALALLNNIALTNNAITGILPISKGGTGTLDAFGWKQVYSADEFNTKIGLKYPFTTQQLVNAVVKKNTPLFCVVNGWAKSSTQVTDFPGSNLSHRTIINYTDANQFYLETVDPFNLTTYICSINGGKVDAWNDEQHDTNADNDAVKDVSHEVMQELARFLPVGRELRLFAVHRLEHVTNKTEREQRPDNELNKQVQDVRRRRDQVQNTRYDTIGKEHPRQYPNLRLGKFP